ADLWVLLADGRASVRQRATRMLVAKRDTPEGHRLLDDITKNRVFPIEYVDYPTQINFTSEQSPVAALARAWMLVQIDSPDARSILYRLLQVGDERLRRVAAYGA